MRISPRVLLLVVAEDGGGVNDLLEGVNGSGTFRFDGLQLLGRQVAAVRLDEELDAVVQRPSAALVRLGVLVLVQSG